MIGMFLFAHTPLSTFAVLVIFCAHLLVALEFFGPVFSESVAM